MIYTFHLCPDEGEFVYIATMRCSLPDAMSRAVDLAFIEGAKRAVLRGQFVCVQDDKGHEVFRTPFATV